jgi:hypothetical protein
MNGSDPYSALADSDSGDTSETPQAPKGNEDGETALLSKSFFGGHQPKPGEQYYVEVVRSYEDEVEVKYPKQVKEEKEKPTAEADTALDAMGYETETDDNPGKEY